MYRILGGDGKEYGPVSADTLRQWVNEGRANAQTQVRPEGGTSWFALGQLPEFAPLFIVSPGAAISPFPQTSPTNHPLALTGFILSLVSITIGLCCCYGFPFNLGGIICSAIGLVQIRNQPERYSGRGLAIAGIILGILSLLLVAVLLVFGVALSCQDIQKEFQKT